MAYKNKEDQRKCHKKWYEKNKAYKREINKRYKRIKKEMVVTFKSEKGCSLCDENYGNCLDFHHLSDETKDGAISKLLHRNVGLKKIIEEMNKCCILCSNCHRKVGDGFLSEPNEFKLNEDYNKWNQKYKKILQDVKWELKEIKELQSATVV